MRDLEVRNDRFEITRECMNRFYHNCGLQKPFKQVNEYSSWLIEQHGYVVEHLAQEVPNVTADDVRHFHKQIMSQMHIEMYMHGNICKQDAYKLTNLIETIIKPRILPEDHWPITRSLIIPPGSKYLYSKTLENPAEVNHCIECYLHTGSKGDREVRAKTELLEQILREPAFDQLRTKEKLGYVVYTDVRPCATTYGLTITIQSLRVPGYLESRIELFLAAQGAALENMSEADFETHKRSVIIKHLKKPEDLAEETNQHWVQIANESYDFGASQKDATRVGQLTKDEMIHFYSTFIAPTSAERAKLAVHLVAQGVSANATLVEAPGQQEYTPRPSNGREIVVIQKVRDYKAGLAVSAVVRPTRQLSDFEDSNSEL
ncbi:Metalloenzyme, LuxS/M16 peptidase-like protein [Microdochium bolleyi]|uniref:Metalloenzyme, LuxS/M16 peptidase-like protein n=1 Tax=Microdochium bolleyi TaxID=196109 RepID=A0A136IJ11_9PEZI|nr:Metalloenzyme, LuxS/M16 peptidase-like protein [Microdochium bolleyi]